MKILSNICICASQNIIFLTKTLWIGTHQCITFASKARVRPGFGFLYNMDHRSQVTGQISALPLVDCRAGRIYAVSPCSLLPIAPICLTSLPTFKGTEPSWGFLGISGMVLGELPDGQTLLGKRLMQSVLYQSYKTLCNQP